MFYELGFTLFVFRLLFMFHVLRFMCFVSCVLFRVSCVYVLCFYVSCYMFYVDIYCIHSACTCIPGLVMRECLAVAAPEGSCEQRLAN